MKKVSLLSLLKSRVVLVTFLFAAFGGALTLLLKIDEMQRYYIALSSLVALLMSLLLSFLLKGMVKKKQKLILKAVLSAGFICFIGSALYHTNLFLNATIPYRYPVGSTSYLVKANAYSKQGEKFREKYPSLADDQLLYMHLGGAPGKTFLWEQRDINANTFKLITSYIILLVFFAGSVFALLEILVMYYAPSLAKTDNTEA